MPNTLLNVATIANFSGDVAKVFHVKVSGDELLAHRIPDDANVRRANSNHVVKKILRDIETGIAVVGTFSIPDPLQVACTKFVQLSSNKIDLHFSDPSASGLLNGGHRIRALEAAKMNGINLSQVWVTLIVYVGLTREEARKKAIDLNTVQAPTKVDLQNYNGAFDFVKAAVPDYNLIYHYDRKSSSDSQCRVVSNALKLMLSLRQEYNQGAVPEPSPYKRHPLSIVSLSVVQRGALLEWCEENIEFLPDLLRLQEYLAFLIDTEAQRKIIPYTDGRFTNTRVAKVPSLLSTNKEKGVLVLAQPISFTVHILPPISALRCWVRYDDDGNLIGWKVAPDRIKAVLKRIWVRHSAALESARKRGVSMTQVAKEATVWDSCYAESLENLHTAEAEVAA